MFQEVDIKKAYFMKLGEISMESNKDNDYIARQLQSIEVITNNDVHQHKKICYRLLGESDPVQSLL